MFHDEDIVSQDSEIQDDDSDSQDSEFVDVSDIKPTSDQDNDSDSDSGENDSDSDTKTDDEDYGPLPDNCIEIYPGRANSRLCLGPKKTNVKCNANPKENEYVTVLESD